MGRKKEDGHEKLLEVNATFDKGTREKNYNKANIEYPQARSNEILLTLDLLDAKPGDTILEIGAGAGVLTYPIAELVTRNGHVYAADNSSNVLSRFGGNEEVDKPITPVHLSQDGRLPEMVLAVDKVVSLATFHHIEKKAKMLEQISARLKPGGTFVLADVERDTKTAAYFDGPVNRICSTGHDCKFLSLDGTERYLERLGFDIQFAKIVEVPWVFDSEAEAATFLRTIHDAKPEFSSEYCLKEAESYLGITRLQNRQIQLGWQLMFIKATKR